MGRKLHSTSAYFAVFVESHRSLIVQHGFVNLVVKFAQVCLIPVLYKPGFDLVRRDALLKVDSNWHVVRVSKIVNTTPSEFTDVSRLNDGDFRCA